MIWDQAIKDSTSGQWSIGQLTETFGIGIKITEGSLNEATSSNDLPPINQTPDSALVFDPATNEASIVYRDKTLPDTGNGKLFDVSTQEVTSGPLTGHTFVTTTNTQTGQATHHWVQADGNPSVGNVAANGNISFRQGHTLHIYHDGNYINSFGTDGRTPLTNGMKGHYQYDSTTGVITEVVSSLGGAAVAGFTSTRHSADGKTWSERVYKFTDRQAVFGVDYAGWRGFNQGLIDRITYDKVMTAATAFLVSNPYKQTSFKNSQFPWLNWNPIGAFYESSSAGFDAAESIADKTFRVMDANGVGLTAAQLQERDVNGDGKLSGAELDGLHAWSDLNEDGVLQRSDTDSSELSSLQAALAKAGLTSLRAGDYAFYTAGNAQHLDAAQHQAKAPLNALVAPTAQASSYATLNGMPRVLFTPVGIINWRPDQIRITQNHQNMIGTDGDDSFDIRYYAAYDGLYFDLSQVRNFYAGGGNDVVGGSHRNDNIWGGTGNDTMWGYAGDDFMYGEEGNDNLHGGIGNDRLDGGTGDDRLFGGLGNDTLIGGDGNDVLVGFTPIDDAKQTLDVGETDNDVMYGGNGNDHMYGGLGDDYMDGGADNDMMFGGAGDDVMHGGTGDDELSGDGGHDVMSGGAGNDKMFGGAGNDRMWGGDGDDIMVGFTASNDDQQTLAEGETDDDIMYGGAGRDFMLGGLGNDRMWGGTGDDELQGGEGDDILYGEEGNDRLFGGAGNDIIYGGDGDDLIVGGMASNQTALAEGASDSNFLYGGAGNDTIIGGIGDDYIDGGAGADNMEGGLGNDTYIVNSVNDVILEHRNEGYDTVISSANYILNANIEELRLVEGYTINGTGNSLDNRIIGNSQDNILDGVTGADVMIGGLGNDTYYVDNAGDQVIELADEGVDTVNASIDYRLGEHVENLTLLDFSKAERGIADGVDILVYGYPKAFELDYMQGDAVAGYRGTCALTAIANLSTQANQALSEAEVVQRAIDNQWAVTDPEVSAHQRGGSNYIQQQALLDSYGIRNDILVGYDEQAIANLIMGGRGVIIGLNSGTLWDDDAYVGTGGVDHVVTVTGVACDAKTGAIAGFYIADSGRGKVSDMTRYVPIADFRASADVAYAYSIYTIEPIKLWEENINGTGNALDNIITGNRGDNVLTGGLGNDTLIGGAGNDTYVFAKGDGRDTIVDNDATLDNRDVLRFTDLQQNNLWFRQVGDNLQIDVMGGSDQITVKDWYVGGVTGTDNQIERIETADGFTMYHTDVERLVQAMAAFAPPAPGQTSWTSGQTENGKVLLAVTH